MTVGADTSGRTGEVLTFSGTKASVRPVRDPATGLLLEQDTGSIVVIFTVHEFTDIIPLEHPLEVSGCVNYSSC